MKVLVDPVLKVSTGNMNRHPEAVCYCHQNMSCSLPSHILRKTPPKYSSIIAKGIREGFICNYLA